MLNKSDKCKKIGISKVLVVALILVFGARVESNTEKKDWLKDREVIEFISHMHKTHKFSLEYLENNFKKYKEKFSKSDPGRPSFWGGIKLSFKTIEFWQGRQNRLHDRIKYRKKNEGWEIIRLAP